MTFEADQLELLIEEYLACRLTGEPLTSFERAMGEDANLREAVELQREIDRELRSAFVPTVVPSVESVAREARQALDAAPPDASKPSLKLAGEPAQVSTAARSPLRRWTWFALAAALVLAAAGVYRGLLGPEDFRLVPPDQLYSFLQNGGWKPAQVCNTPQEFAALVKGRLGQGLVPDVAKAASSGIALLGWGYEDDYNGSPLSKKTMMLLTTVENDRVLVLIDQKKNRRDLHVRRGSTLHVIERDAGSLVLYEITPRTDAKVLDLLTVPR